MTRRYGALRRQAGSKARAAPFDPPRRLRLCGGPPVAGPHLGPPVAGPARVRQRKHTQARSRTQPARARSQFDFIWAARASTGRFPLPAVTCVGGKLQANLPGRVLTGRRARASSRCRPSPPCPTSSPPSPPRCRVSPPISRLRSHRNSKPRVGPSSPPTRAPRRCLIRGGPGAKPCRGALQCGAPWVWRLFAPRPPPRSQRQASRRDDSETSARWPEAWARLTGPVSWLPCF